MHKIKEIVLGLIVGYVAFLIYVISYGYTAYLPISYQKLTDGMEKETAVLLIRVGLTIETLLAALPMAIAAYVFMKVLKLKANTLFLLSSISVLLGQYFYSSFVDGYPAFNMIVIMSVLIPCIVLWFSLSAPNKSLKNGRHTAAL